MALPTIAPATTPRPIAQPKQRASEVEGVTTAAAAMIAAAARVADTLITTNPPHWFNAPKTLATQHGQFPRNYGEFAASTRRFQRLVMETLIECSGKLLFFHLCNSGVVRRPQ
ncbi:MAG: hypothetical protein ACLPKB_35755 [Xanthobacteraceae bacterium]